MSKQENRYKNFKYMQYKLCRLIYPRKAQAFQRNCERTVGRKKKKRVAKILINRDQQVMNIGDNSLLIFFQKSIEMDSWAAEEVKAR